MESNNILKVHEAIHNPTSNEVIIEDVKYPILKNEKNLRQVSIEGIDFHEGDSDGGSLFSKMAKEGHKITWGEKQVGNWILVLDGKILSY